MEEQNQNPQSGNMNKIILPTVVAALIVIAAIGYYVYSNNNSKNQQGMMGNGNGEAMMDGSNGQGQGMMARHQYRNGSYNVKGDYVSPGGPREVGVTITLNDGVIADAEAEVLATDATSIRFQEEFINNFKPEVIGKNIDEVALTKVSGSSLTPKGFNDALEKIKVEASS